MNTAALLPELDQLKELKCYSYDSKINFIPAPKTVFLLPAADTQHPTTTTEVS